MENPFLKGNLNYEKEFIVGAINTKMEKPLLKRNY